MLLSASFGALAEEATDVLGSNGITADDLEYVANIFKQVNEGNDPGLDGGDWYAIELKFAKAAAALGADELRQDRSTNPHTFQTCTLITPPTQVSAPKLVQRWY